MEATVKDAIEARLNRMNEAIAWAENSLKSAPAGSLLIDTHKKFPRFYHRVDPQDKKGTYLGKQDETLITKLAQKDYDKQLLNVALKEKKRLERLQALDNKGATADPMSNGDILIAVYDSLSATRQTLVEPFDMNDDQYAQHWLAQDYCPNTHSFGIGGLFSQKGQQMRSKSEVIIADQLAAADVPYRYEQPLYIGGYSSVYPDFTVLNKRTRVEYVWEHLGAMDDPDYCRQALEKLNRYALAGYLPGDKLLVTQESAAVPLDTRVVSALIERYLK